MEISRVSTYTRVKGIIIIRTMVMIVAGVDGMIVIKRCVHIIVSRGDGERPSATTTQLNLCIYICIYIIGGDSGMKGCNMLSPNSPCSPMVTLSYPVLCDPSDSPDPE